jgi:hypothetical protein
LMEVRLKQSVHRADNEIGGWLRSLSIRIFTIRNDPFDFAQGDNDQ